MYEAVEPELKQGRPHRWLLIAMMTADLRENRLEEATSIFNRLNTTYPHTPEVEEGEYRLGVYYFDLHKFDKAKEYFTELRTLSPSTDYLPMLDKYLAQIPQVTMAP
jgi:outer membrane protein assembly factor BamD (BamD/ComL family)